MLNSIAIVSESASVSTNDLLKVSGALQKQVARDFGPLWNVEATVDAFASLADVPAGYWPLIIVDQIASGDKGIHGQRDGQPIALVETGNDWSLSASHECLEMLADPWGRRLVAGDSLEEDGTRVEYVVEVCDPCQDAQFGYRVNEVLVADFYTPNYFDPSGSTGGRYDFTGSISRPREVLENGYLSWRDPATNRLHRADRISGDLWLSDLGVVPTSAVSLRSVIDSRHGKGRRLRRLHLAENYARKCLDPRCHQAAAQARQRRLCEQFASLRLKQPSVRPSSKKSTSSKA